MALKDLFFVNEEKKKKVEVSKKTSFPKDVAPSKEILDERMMFPADNGPWKSTVKNSSCEPYIEEVIKLYERGFDGLNIEGWDFYEMYKAVLAVGIDNKAAYQMAYNMGKGMDSTVTKEKLLSQAQYYLDEIIKVYKNYVSNGQSKKLQLQGQMDTEKDGLLSEVKSLREQLSEIQRLLSLKEGMLENIESKYQPEIEVIDCKIMANDHAKAKIMGSIDTVITQIKTNL